CDSSFNQGRSAYVCSIAAENENHFVKTVSRKLALRTHLTARTLDRRIESCEQLTETQCAFHRPAADLFRPGFHSAMTLREVAIM
ncbi:MAG: hypothetical protein MK179_22270, partial [Pirellulaceae bacterium]|nr:hypothetical protein [Pirellulaceae bacterium]